MITVHNLTKADLPELATLYRELTEEPADLETMATTFAWMSSNPAYRFLVAKRDGAIVGSLMGIVCRELLGKCRPFLVIENVVVSPQHRRLGIGRRLMTEIESFASELDCSMIEFCSASHRKEAHRFYEPMGYDPDEVRGFRKWLKKPPEIPADC